ERSVSKLFEGINARREIELNRFIYSLGIRHIGSENAKLLAKNYSSFKDLYEKAKGFEQGSVDFAELMEIDGIGTKVADSIAIFFQNPKHIEIIDELVSELKIKDFEQKQTSNS